MTRLAALLTSLWHAIQHNNRHQRGGTQHGPIHYPRKAKR